MEDKWLNDIHIGDAYEVLKKMPDESIDMCVTSPPYWGLRDYGEEGQLGLEDTPEEYVNRLVEIFSEVKRILKPSGTVWLNLGDTYASTRPKGTSDNGQYGGNTSDYYSKFDFGRSGKNSCVGKKHNSKKGRGRCPEDLKMKDLIGIPWRVAFALQKDGWYLRNDIIWHKPNAMPESVKDRCTTSHEHIFLLSKEKQYFYDADAIREPHKDKSKKRAMRGDSGNIHEEIKDAKFGNPDTIMEGREHKGYDNMEEKVNNGKTNLHPNGRNKRDVWEITTKPFPGAHFAVFPPELPKTCIKAGCPPKVCSECGKPYEREYVKEEKILSVKPRTGKHKDSEVNSAGNREHYITTQRKYNPDQEKIALFLKNNGIKEFEEELNEEFGEHTWPHWIRTDDSGACLPDPDQYEKLKQLCNLPDNHDEEMLTTVEVSVDDKGGKEKFKGWKPTCDCDTEETEPGIVLDPFIGAGTTGMVAKNLNRKWVGIDISEEYREMALKRIKNGDKYIRKEERVKRKAKKARKQNKTLDKFTTVIDEAREDE